MNSFGRFLAVPVVAASLMLAGCQTPPSKEQTGAVTGAVLGGVLGAQVGKKGSGTRTGAIIAGTIIGGMIGGSIGRTMDNQDRMIANQTLETYPTHQSKTWQNPDSGNQYTMTPTRTYETSGTPCREYTMDAVIDGRQEKVYGTACRQADGSWQVQ